MSLPIKKNLKIIQGATNRFKYIWKTGPVDAPVPVDLTGATAKAQFRATIDSSTVLLELTTENGGIVLGGIDGTIELIISPELTEGATWKSALYDLEIYLSTDTIRFTQGSATLVFEVTRG